MHKITNPIFQELLKLNLINKKNIVKISNFTRDKKIKVYKDKETQVIFLERYVSSLDYYSTFKKISKKKVGNKIYSLINLRGGKIIKTQGLNDDKRRYLTLKKYLLKKSVLDFGCGWGGFLNLLRGHNKSCAGLELRKHCIKHIKKSYEHIDINDNLNKFKRNFDVITLFHVLEHIPRQVDSLKQIKKKMNKGGKIIIEVPSAKDYLISLDQLPEFKKFTFWSEHLILHTEKSLKKILTVSGFKKIKITYFQRYGYANHLGWLLTKKPGGHEHFKQYVSKKIDNDYRNSLIQCKKTDTLIAIAEN